MTDSSFVTSDPLAGPTPTASDAGPDRDALHPSAVSPPPPCSLTVSAVANVPLGPPVLPDSAASAESLTTTGVAQPFAVAPVEVNTSFGDCRAPADGPASFRVLYMFAGPDRYCGLRDALLRALHDDEVSGLPVVRLSITELDILRGGADHDLSAPSHQATWLSNIRRANVDVCVASPPCNTHSRARHSNRRGPPPLRDHANPRGFTHLRGADRTRCDEANALVDFSWAAVEAALSVRHPDAWRRTRVVLEHPEHLGEARLGCPASIWHPPRRLFTFDGDEAHRWAVFQCQFGDLPYMKPTGLLSDCPTFGNFAHCDWPSFHSGRRFGRQTSFLYSGPLPGGGTQCGHSHHSSLERRPGDKHFKTTGTAAWAAGLCSAIARALIDDYRARMPQGALKTGVHTRPLALSESAPAPPHRPGEPPPQAPSDAQITSEAVARGRAVTSSLIRHPLMLNADLSDDEIPCPHDPFSYPRLGWQGTGEPFMVRCRMNTRRPVADGGGLCSPGKWAPEHRCLPSWPEAFRASLTHALAPLDIKDILARLAAGRQMSSPFPEALVDNLRSTLCAQLKSGGFDPSPRQGDGAQEIQVRLVQALMQACEDPDAAIMDAYATGVRLGVDYRMPRAKGVFFPKARWAMKEQSLLDAQGLTAWEGSCAVPNHPSGVEHIAWVRKHLRSLADSSPPQGFFLSDAAAREQFGERLAVAAVGTVHKGWNGSEELFRLIHDATHGVGVNQRIKVRDVDDAPTAKDLKLIRAVQARRRVPTFGLAADAEHAHRLVLIDARDWGLQACRASPDDPIFVNTRGTYGLSSAAYWWGRMGAALARVAHYVIGNNSTPDSLGALWLLRFADDFNIEAEGPKFALTILGTLLLWTVLGLPLAWAKCRGGRAYEWIGYELDLKQHTLGISEKRA